MIDTEPLKTRFAGLEWKNAISREKLPKDKQAREELECRLCAKLGIKNLDTEDKDRRITDETRTGVATAVELPETVKPPEPKEDKIKFEKLGWLISNLKSLLEDHPNNGNDEYIIGGNIYLFYLYSITSNLDALELNITDLFPDIDPEIVPYIKLSYAERLLENAEKYAADPKNIGIYHPKNTEYLGRADLNGLNLNPIGGLHELKNDRQLVELMDQERYDRALKAHLTNELYRRLLKHFDHDSEATSQQITVPDIQGFNNEFYVWLKTVHEFGVEAKEILGIPLEEHFMVTDGMQEIDIAAQRELFDILEKIAGHKFLDDSAFPRLNLRDSGNVLGTIMDDFTSRHGLTGKSLSLKTRQPWDITRILAQETPKAA